MAVLKSCLVGNVAGYEMLKYFVIFLLFQSGLVINSPVIVNEDSERGPDASDVIQPFREKDAVCLLPGQLLGGMYRIQTRSRVKELGGGTI